MKTFVAALTLAFVVLSCKKEITELPAATDTGSNTFGANVNGAMWTPQKFGVVPTKEILEAHYEINRSVVINARNFASSPTESEFEIYLNHVTGPGAYPLNVTTSLYPANSGNYAYYVERRFRPTNEWMTNSQYTGVVNVTKSDTVNRIISGTFEFTAANIYGGAGPLKVTQGRFDIKIP
jgi:hypothetical protein